MGSITLTEEQGTPTSLTAVVKGAGPSGLAATITLTQLGFSVTLVEKRPWRPYGAGRRNMVGIRADALRILDELGALRYLVEAGLLTELVEGVTIDEWLTEEEGRTFNWDPLLLKYPHRYGKASENGADIEKVSEEAGGYEVPEKMGQQIPSYYVDLGDLEDAMLRVCNGMKGVRLVHEATIKLSPSSDGERYEVWLIRDSDQVVEYHDNLGCPDLIVCASGKNDTEVAEDLDFERKVGVKLDPNVLPEPGSRLLRLGQEAELESQWQSVFGVVNPKRRMGAITHFLLKDATGEPQQPICEIEMSHKGASHCVLLIPRGMDINDKAGLERYLVNRVNAKLDMSYKDFQEMRDQDVLVAGDPLRPVLVESATAPKFVYGSNVVLVGDAAMCCSPASGIGADISVTSDSQNVKLLGQDLITSRQIEAGEVRVQAWEDALDRFNMRKAESAVIWSQASRKFYISHLEAENLRKAIQKSSSEQKQ